MAFIQYLAFDGTPLPLPDSYEVQMVDIEADSGGETEAGTTQRDVVRLGVVRISVSFSVSAKWLRLLTGFKQREKISVDYFDTETLAVKNAEMFIDGYTGLTACGSFGGRFCCIMALMEMGVVLGDGCGKGNDTVPAHGGAWLWRGGGAAGAFGEYGEKLLQEEPSDGGGGEGAGKSLPGIRSQRHGRGHGKG